MGQNKEYYAFISYKREDEKWAKWLQNKLEHYKFPTNLNGRTDLPKNIRPTFRDVTDLSPGLLAEEIDKALRSSEWLIVICSPRSAKSPWVCKEAQTFIDLGRADHIIPFVIEGNPFSKDSSTECYPEALLNLTDGRELLAANINEMGREAASIKVVARMFNLRFDTLWQRYEREKKTRLTIAALGLIVLALICLGIGGYIAQINVRLEEEKTILRNQIFETEIAKIPTIINELGVKPAYDCLEKLSHEYNPLTIEQKQTINNRLIHLANAISGKSYLYYSIICKEGEIDYMSIAPNDSILAVSSFYAGNVSIINFNDYDSRIILDNYIDIKARPEKLEFSNDSQYLYVQYGSYTSDHNEICMWDIKKQTYRNIPLGKYYNKGIVDFSVVGNGIIVEFLNNKILHINNNEKITEVSTSNEDVTAIANINDSLFCVATDKNIDIYNINDIDKPVLRYTLEFKYVKYLTGAGNKIAALYSNDTIVVYNVQEPYREIIDKNWSFDQVYYEGAVRFNRKGDRLYALDGNRLYNLNIYNGEPRFWDHIIDMGYQIKNEHGKLVTLKDKIILSDANEIKIIALGKRYKPGKYRWKGDASKWISAHQFSGLVDRKDSLVIYSIGTWDYSKNNGEYKNNYVLLSDFQRNQIEEISGHKRKITGLDFNNQTKEVYTCSLDSTLQIYNVQTKRKKQYQLNCEPTCLTVKDDICCIGDKQGCIHLFKGNNVLCTLNKHNYSISQIVADKNNGRVFIGDVYGNIVQLNGDNNIVNQCKYSNSGITALVLDVNGNLIVGQRDGWVRILKRDNLEIINSKKLGEQISSITLNGIGQIVVSTIKHGYSDEQASENTYILSSKDLLTLYELLGVTAPNELWWLSDYELIGTNGMRFFNWELPKDILEDIRNTLK